MAAHSARSFSLFRLFRAASAMASCPCSLRCLSFSSAMLPSAPAKVCLALLKVAGNYPLHGQAPKHIACSRKFVEVGTLQGGGRIHALCFCAAGPALGRLQLLLDSIVGSPGRLDARLHIGCVHAHLLRLLLTALGCMRDPEVAALCQEDLTPLVHGQPPGSIAHLQVSADHC